MERCIGLCEVGGAERDRLRVQPLGFAKRAADTNTLELLVFVAGIGHWGYARLRAQLNQFGPAPAEQRPHQRDVTAGHSHQPPHPGEPIDPRAARKPHDKGFRLIVEMVGRNESAETLFFRPIAEEAIARHAGALLNSGVGLLFPLDR